jgi:hypothetical protein
VPPCALPSRGHELVGPVSPSGNTPAVVGFAAVPTVGDLGGQPFGTVLADPPWRFSNRGKLRTLAPGRRQVNMIETMKREHSRKPDEQYQLIRSCTGITGRSINGHQPRCH